MKTELLLDSGLKIRNPKHSEVWNALKRLDGESNTELTIVVPTAGSLSVVGGKDDIYVVVFFDNFGDAYTLVNPKGNKAKIVRTVAGGQPSEFSERHCVTKSAAKANLDSFFTHHKLAEGMWETDNGDVIAETAIPISQKITYLKN